LDALDIKILGKMCFEYQALASCELRRPSPYSIARSIGLDVKTVRGRIKRIEGELVKSYQVIPNLAIFGLKLSGYALFFKDPGLKKKAITRLNLLEEVQAVYEFMSSLLVHLVWSGPDVLERRVTLLRELGETDPIKVYDLRTEPVKARLSLLDWEILKSLGHDALKPAKSVAEEVGVTARTVKNRLERMIEENAVLMLPVLNTERVSNLLLYWALLFLDEEKRNQAVDQIVQAFQDRIVFQAIHTEGAVSLLLYATEMGEPEGTYNRLVAVDGVSSVHMDFLREIHYCPACIDRLVDEQISMLEKR